MIWIEQLTVDYQEKPVGVEHMPRFSWVIQGDKKNILQTAYQLQIAEDENFTTCIYDSGKTNADTSIHICPDGPVLTSRTKYFARVKVWDNQGEETSFSHTGTFVTALLNREWKAIFISAETKAEKEESKGTYIRKEFCIEKKVKEAYACTTALGVYQFFLNGQKVGTDELAPGWTSYDNHLLYQTYEITDLLQEGTNVTGAMIGAGWYKGLMGFLGRRNNYGEQTAFLGELYIVYEDGSTEVIPTDASWEAANAPVVFSEIYDGEIYDANLEITKWSEPGCTYTEWHRVEVVPFPMEVLKAQSGSKCKVMNRIPAKEVIITPKGETVVNFGQNLSGWVEFCANGKKGDVVELHCFEMLDAKGNVYIDNLRGAKQMIQYTFRAEEEVVFHPHFTFQGFQYAHVVQYPGEVKAENFVSCAVHSEMTQTGFFTCSNPDLNQLQSNILWGLKSNFLDVPTDCPQRNERVGWTGDAQIFCRTACYLMNTYNFFDKWLKDVAFDQTKEGGVPHVVPDIISGHEGGDWLLSQGTHSAAAWADVAVINPWTMYQVYGDTAILIQQYDSMKKWIQFMERHAKDYIWNYRLQFGDWVALDAEEGSYFGATPNDLTCTAYFAYSTRLMGKTANVLGYMEDAVYFEALYKKILDKYQTTFFDENGHLRAQTQTAQIISLYFKLVPEVYVKNVVNDLLKLLEKEHGHLVTGFVGTPYFCHVLSQNGCLKEAYELLLKDDFPSWLYQVKMGATTVWEHWDGLKPDGTMWSADMNSFNHYAYGAIGEWLYRVAAGIEIDEQCPGYKHIIIQPHIGGGLTYVDGEYASVYGTIRSHWRLEKEKIILEVVIPANTTAKICLTQANQIVDTDGIEFARTKDGFAGEAGSGKYKVIFEM